VVGVNHDITVMCVHIYLIPTIFRRSYYHGALFSAYKYHDFNFACQKNFSYVPCHLDFTRDFACQMLTQPFRQRFIIKYGSSYPFDLFVIQLSIRTLKEIIDLVLNVQNDLIRFDLI
jgi:hypothetical protein